MERARKVIASLLVVIALLGVARLLRGAPPPPPPPEEEEAPPEPPARVLTGDPALVPHLGLPLERVKELGKKLEPLQERKPPARRGEWMDMFHEDGQTLVEFIRSDPNRPTAERGTLYVVPLGEFSQAQRPLLEAAAEGLGTFFGLPVKRLPPLSPDLVPADSRREGSLGKEQLLATAVLDLLKARRPADAVAVIALTPIDLYPEPSWNFVFGQADLEERVGVWSLARLGEVEEVPDRVLRRTVQVALHETGHMLGIHHCIFHSCGMSGSNSLHESDSQPVHYCVEDEMKIWWSSPVEPAARYRALAEFARRHGLDEEAQFWARSAEVLAP